VASTGIRGCAGYEGVGKARAVIFLVLVALVMLLQLRTSRSREIEN